jgi:hypothetical protein
MKTRTLFILGAVGAGLWYLQKRNAGAAPASGSVVDQAVAAVTNVGANVKAAVSGLTTPKPMPTEKPQPGASVGVGGGEGISGAASPWTQNLYNPPSARNGTAARNAVVRSARFAGLGR